MPIINSDAEWQRDRSSPCCFNCATRFTFFNRRHHCRKCGNVVCNSCSSNFILYDRRYVKVVRSSSMFMEDVDEPHRTCDVCMIDLRTNQLVSAGNAEPETQEPESRDGAAEGDEHSHNGGVDVATSDVGVVTSDVGVVTSDVDVGPASPGHESSISASEAVSTSEATASHGSNTPVTHVETANDEPAKPQDIESELHMCPVCGKNLEREDPDHVEECLKNAEFNGSPEQHNSNRMLVYKVPKLQSIDTVMAECEECPICYEELLPGEKVGRLECLCVFHYKCIKSWFNKRGPGNCPLHAVRL